MNVDVVTEASTGIVARQVAVAGLTILLYDHVITMDKEALLVWPGPFSLPKLLYYINRYAVPAHLIFRNYQLAPFRPSFSDSFCKIQFAVLVAVHVTTKTTGIMLVCLRVGALYHGRKWIMRFVWICFILFYVLRWIVCIQGAATLYRSFKYSAFVKVCFAEQSSEMLSGIFLWVVPIAFDVLLVALTASKGYRNALLLKRSFRSPIFYTLFRDGIIYFIIIVTLRAFGGGAWALLRPAMLEAITDLEWSLETALISRFFLNLRSVYHGGTNTSDSQTGTAFAGDNFAPRYYLPGRRQRRVDTTDIFGDASGGISAPGRVNGIGSRHWDEQPTPLREETLELGTRHGVVYTTAV